MQRKPVHWDDLRVVLAIARTGTFAGASRTLGTDRTTVMRRLDALETALAVRLVSRSRDGCALTDAGRAAIAKVEAIEDAITSLDLEVGGHDAKLDGVVRITTPEWLACVLAPELMRFRLAQPGIQIELVTTNQVLSLTRREADIAIRNVRPTQANLTIRKLGPMAFGLYAARSYLEERGVPGDWSKHDVLTFDTEMAYMPGYKWLAAHAPANRVALRATEILPLVAAARAGMGIALLPCALGATDPDLVSVRPGVVARFDVWSVVHRDLLRTKRVQLVSDFVHGVCTAHGPTLRGEIGRPRKASLLR